MTIKIEIILMACIFIWLANMVIFYLRDNKIIICEKWYGFSTPLNINYKQKIASKNSLVICFAIAFNLSNQKIL